MTDFADSIKTAVSMPDVCETYGIHVDRGGFASCPFHGEKTGSMKVYPGQRGWYCFGCHKGGDIIDFVQQYFGIDFQTACKKLNNDFNLGLPISDDADREALREANRAAYLRRKEADRRKKHRESLQNAYDSALNKFAELDALAEKAYTVENLSGLAPSSQQTDLSDLPSDGLQALLDAFPPDIVDAMKNIEAAWFDLCQASNDLYQFDHNTA